jgi:hypothetical protein
LLIKLEKFGGVVPKIKDPFAIPQDKAQQALNCRFDIGGIAPYFKDDIINTPENIGPLLSVFKYYDDSDVGWFFTWNSDVDAIKAPLPGDVFNRVFYTEAGVFKVTDKYLFTGLGLQLITTWTNGSPGYNTFTSVLSENIAAAINTAGTSESGHSTSVPTIVGKKYRIVATLTLTSGQAPTLSLTNPTTSNLLAAGANTIEFVATSTATILTMTNSLVANWSCTFTMHKYGNDYPTSYLLPSPPAPVIPPVVNVTTVAGCVVVLKIENATCSEADGTYAVIFSGGDGGVYVAGTYTVLNHLIIATDLTNKGSNYTSSPSAVTQSGTGSLYASIGDPTLIETRGYVYTYVNSYGEEGPPSPVSNLVDVYDADTSTITEISNAGVDALYAIENINIYRLNQSLSSAQFQFVDQIAAATTSYVDSLTDAQLAEILPSAEWDGPPVGISGLIALPNGVVAGFVDNQLCLSVPNYPHAWPVAYQKATDRDIVGLGNIGTTIVIMTKGNPYGVICNDPSNTTMEKIVGGLSCIAKRSICPVPTAGVIAYASPEGLMTIGQDGAKLVTANIFTREEWNDLYNPATISAFYWQGKYVGFYTNGSAKAGFIFDLVTGDWVDLDFYATAGYHDPVDGRLYLIIDGVIVSLSDTIELRELNWLSKRFLCLPTNLSWIKVVGRDYPVYVDIILRDIPMTLSIIVTERSPARFGITGLTTAFEVRIQGTSQVSGIFLASTLGEIPV